MKCPHCGAVGTDDEPYPEENRQAVAELTGNPVQPLRKSQEQYAFEVRGNAGGRPARACLACGRGVRITILPPRFRKMSDAEWEHHNRQWFDWKAGEEERLAEFHARLEQQRVDLDHDQGKEV